MATSEERIRVLRMVEEGKLSPDAAAKLLAALTESAKTAQSTPRAEQARASGGSGVAAEQRAGARPKRLRIKISGNRGGKNKNIDVDLPVGAVRVLNTVLNRLGATSTIAAGAQGVSAQDVVNMVDSGMFGRIVDIRGDDGEHIEVMLE
jgi:hypothetical protein